MRLGIGGFSAFWCLLGRSIVAAMMATKRVSDPFPRSACVFTVVTLVTWVLMGMVDTGIVDLRETVLIGSLIGLVSSLLAMESRDPNSATMAHRPANRVA